MHSIKAWRKSDLKPCSASGLRKKASKSDAGFSKYALPPRENSVFSFGGWTCFPTSARKVSSVVVITVENQACPPAAVPPCDPLDESASFIFASISAHRAWISPSMKDSRSLRAVSLNQPSVHSVMASLYPPPPPQRSRQRA